MKQTFYKITRFYPTLPGLTTPEGHATSPRPDSVRSTCQSLITILNPKPMKNEINGLYDDDGNKINPDLLPVPGLCITCKSYGIDDWEENILCNLNRFDQRNSPNFKCGAYEKK